MWMTIKCWKTSFERSVSFPMPFVDGHVPVTSEIVLCRVTHMEVKLVRSHFIISKFSVLCSYYTTIHGVHPNYIVAKVKYSV